MGCKIGEGQHPCPDSFHIVLARHKVIELLTEGCSSPAYESSDSEFYFSRWRRPGTHGEWETRPTGSTDMGNVSLVMPSIHPMIGINSLPAVNHQPEFAAHCVTPEADKALEDGALAMAWTCIDLAMNHDVREGLMARG